MMSPSNDFEQCWFPGYTNGGHPPEYIVFTAPDGLIIGIYGPFSRFQSDHYIINTVEAQNIFQTRYAFGGVSYKCYGDMRYTTKDPIIMKYRPSVTLIDQHKEAINKSMEKVRIGIEQIFGDLKMTFFEERYKKAIKMGLTDLQDQICVACLLHNFRVCLRETSALSDTCKCEPPSFIDYVSMCA